MNDYEDLIDFPCSSTWLNHYHSRGMTPRYTMFDEQGNYLGHPSDISVQVTELTDAIKSFRYRIPPPQRPKNESGGIRI